MHQLHRTHLETASLLHQQHCRLWQLVKRNSYSLAPKKFYLHPIHRQNLWALAGTEGRQNALSTLLATVNISQYPQQVPA